MRKNSIFDVEESEEVAGSIEDVEDDQRGIYWISRMKNASNQGMGKKKQVNDTDQWQWPSNRLLPPLVHVLMPFVQFGREKGVRKTKTRKTQREDSRNALPRSTLCKHNQANGLLEALFPPRFTRSISAIARQSSRRTVLEYCSVFSGRVGYRMARRSLESTVSFSLILRLPFARLFLFGYFWVFSKR